MGTLDMALMGFAAMALAIAAGPSSGAQEDGRGLVDMGAPPASVIDYDGFAALVAEVEPYRRERLIDLATFNAMAGEPDTLILDARSASAYAQGHIRGAVNLPFSDFTADKLAAIIAAPDTRILIYCNNNFSDNAPPVMLKSAPLALNVPTFLNLYGYGYRNVYELSDLVSMADPEVSWVAAAG